MQESGAGRDLADATITIDVGIREGADLSAGVAKLRGVWRVRVTDDERGMIWDETLENLITTEGGNDWLTVYTGGTFGTLYASAFLAGTPTLTATYAAKAVTEIGTAALANRVALTWGAASGKAIVGTATLPILSASTITGIMTMKGGSGILTPGDTAAVGGKLFSEVTLGVPQVISTTGNVDISYTLSV